jgi:hypothetical protein
MGNLTYNDFFKLATKKDPISRKDKFCAKMQNKKIGTQLFKQPFDMEDKTKASFPIKGNDSISKNNKNNLDLLCSQIGVDGAAEDRKKFNSLRFKSSTNKEYSMSQFTKTKEFGGGAGSGGGADLTKYTESGQCYVCSLVFNILKGPILSSNDWSSEKLNQAAKYCDTGVISLDSIITNVAEREDWTISMIRTANFLYKKYGTKFKSPVYFHRGSAFMSKIYSYKKICQEKNPVLGSFDNNKWNPGDIWMTTLGLNVQSLPELSTATWQDLNKDLYKLYTDNKLLGVSLKKVEGVANEEKYNVPNVAKTTYRYESYRLSAESKGFFNSIDMYMKISGVEIQFRATQTTKSWQGEVKGGSAAGGKIGGGNVNEYLKKQRDDKKGLFENSESEVFAFTKTQNFMQEFYRLYTLYYNGNDKLTDIKDFESAAKAKDSDSPGSFYFSKYMNLKFLDLFLTSNKKNELASDFLYYAKSDTENSSFFIKIS